VDFITPVLVERRELAIGGSVAFGASAYQGKEWSEIGSDTLAGAGWGLLQGAAGGYVRGHYFSTTAGAYASLKASFNSTSNVTQLGSSYNAKHFGDVLGNWSRSNGYAPNSTITMLRGMSKAEYDALVANPTLASHANRQGIIQPQTAWRRFRHTLSSVNPASPYVSLTKLPIWAKYFGRGGGVVVQMDVPTASLRRSWNYPENEYLVLGGTRVASVRLLDSSYHAGWRTYAAYPLENTALLGFLGAATYAVGNGIYHGGTALYEYVSSDK
jgi:hypothetical protein